jgi:hypothetical protein
VKRNITLSIEMEVDFTVEDVVRFIRIGKGESCEDLGDKLEIVVGEDSEVELCERCGKYMDAHGLFNECPCDVRLAADGTLEGHILPD